MLFYLKTYFTCGLGFLNSFLKIGGKSRKGTFRYFQTLKGGKFMVPFRLKGTFRVPFWEDFKGDSDTERVLYGTFRVTFRVLSGSPKF